MHRPRKEKKTTATPVPAMVRRFRYALFLFCLFIPAGFAQDIGKDIGLHNPVEMDFGEFQPAARNTENFARKTPTFNDRTLPTLRQPETIRQVSTFGEPDFAPFPATVPPATTQPTINPFDWEAAHAVPNYLTAPPPSIPYQDYIPYDPQVFAMMQSMPNMDPKDMELGYFPQLAMQQLAQQYHQGVMMDGMNPYMNPYADMYAQQGHFGQIDPYNMMGNQNMQEQQQVYQMLMLQELARLETTRQQLEAREREDDIIIDESRRQADANWTLNNLVPVRVSSPLGETLLVCAKTISPFNSPSGPDKGVGMPLVGKSWLDHPYYFGGFVGVMNGSELVSKMINQKSGATGGLTFGYNFNDYWGLESRLHFAAIDIQDTAYARGLFEEAWIIISPDAPIPPATTRTNKLTILDAAVHYYPLGNAKWRPYFKYGLGIGRQNYVNTFGYESTSNIITMPMGLGMRYWWNERIAIQMDLNNNVIFASGNTKTQCNFAFTMGLTYAFGNGRRTAPIHYWPATPSMGTKW